MKETDVSHVYGPVSSKRLGRSLGIDLVPFKTCSFDCTYCQLGRTTTKTIERAEHVPVGEVLDELRRALKTVSAPDYIGLAGSGEPTLHSGLGALIAEIKEMTDLPVAVLTNGSLLWQPEVAAELSRADVVMPSLDAGSEALFQKVNRPEETLSLDRMVEGLVDFTHGYRGEVWLEVMLLSGVTSEPQEVAALAELVQQIEPALVQLNTATRPAPDHRAQALSPGKLHQLAELFGVPTEVITERPKTEPQVCVMRSDIDSDILALLSRRPCTARGLAVGLGLHVADAVKRLEVLARKGVVRATWGEGAVFFECVGSQTRS